MTRDDINDLFDLLRIYFPNSNKLNNKTLKSAWFLLLEPFDRETVRAALVDQLRENKHFPDPQSIASRCPAPLAQSREKSFGTPKKTDPKREEYQRRHAELVERRRAAGFPGTFEEAKKAGLKYTEFMEMMDNSGFGTGEIIEEIWGGGGI